MSEKQKSPLMRAWVAIGSLARQATDVHEFNKVRIQSIENRLAALDGGPDAAGARVAAYDAVNASRRRAGDKPLGFKIT